MNKIFNWTFGACFRTLGRFLAIFIVGALLVFIGSKIGFKFPDLITLKVNAQTINGWAAELPTLSRVDFRSCNSTDCSTDISSDVDYFESPYELRSFTYNSSHLTIGNNGYVMLTPYYVNKNYLYEVNYYVCSNVNIQSSNYNFDIYASAFSRGIPVAHDYKLVTRSGLDNQPIIDGGRTFNNCNLFTGLIAPSVDSGWLGYRIRSTTNVSNVVLSLIAVEVNQLGIYTSALDEIIENSGFATADSVEQVQESVTQVQEEIQQTNDTITDSTSPDVSGMTDLAGYLPPGPLDSVLNLPLSILNSLNSKLSSSCSPLSLTLPFVNLPLNIPCLSTIFNQIAGLNFLWESIGVILGALIMYKYLTYLYNWVDDVTSLRHTRARLFGAKSDADNWGGVE